MDKIKQKLIDLAVEMTDFSYCPYSNYSVGAAILTESGKIYKGCNIENAAYSPSICAERCAAASAVAEGERKFIAIAIACKGETFPYPCGVCRQFLSEFCEDMEVYLIKNDGEVLQTSFYEIFPNAFKKSDIGL